jgi:DNA invertase Pin-like site-specific DNA recombinase
MLKAIAYYRVSTAKQGASGLGMDAQRAAVEALCQARDWDLIAPPFEEVESGKRNDRPELRKAVDRCRQTGAILVIAKMDRVGRRAARLLTLLEESGVRFVAADDPDADWTSIAIKAVIAQREGDEISRRTKQALAIKREQLRAKGERLGNPNGAAALVRAGRGSAAGGAAARRIADSHAAMLQPVVERMKGEGIVSLGAIARALNDEGMRTPRGGSWHASSVRNLLARLEAA